MNCKQGDLAYIKSALVTPEITGRIVRVVRPLLGVEHFVSTDGTSVFCDRPAPDAAWVIEANSPLPWRGAESGLLWFTQRAIWDRNLRPIRDQPGEDEMLTRVGKPRDIVARGEGVS